MNSPYFEIVDKRFESFVSDSARLEKHHTGMEWAEGPAYFADGDYLIFSDIPNNIMFKWDKHIGITKFRDPSDFSNGNSLDLSGRLITCEHGTRRVTRTEADGSVTVIADRFQGKRFNWPNDLVVKSDGSIWFTDPPYGILSNVEGYAAESEIGNCNVYRIAPDSENVTVVADDFDKPNGIAFSPDEKILYISDTGATHNPEGPHHIRAFDVVDGKSLNSSRVFAEIAPAVPDGFRLDVDGNVWTSAGDGVHCYAPDGKLLGKILVPEIVANVEFGGLENNQLFITASTSLYSILLVQKGAR